MGSSLSSYFSMEDISDIDQILEHTQQDFTQIFTSVFTSEQVVQPLMVENYYSKAVDMLKDTLQLSTAPIATTKVKIGTLKKQGGRFKTWKKRFPV